MHPVGPAGNRPGLPTDSNQVRIDTQIISATAGHSSGRIGRRWNGFFWVLIFSLRGHALPTPKHARDVQVIGNAQRGNGWTLYQNGFGNGGFRGGGLGGGVAAFHGPLDSIAQQSPKHDVRSFGEGDGRKEKKVHPTNA